MKKDSATTGFTVLKFLASRESFALITFVLFLSLSVGGWYIYSSLEKESAQQRFDARVNEVSLRIRERLLGNEQIVQGALGLIASSSEVTREEWRSYVSYLGLDKNYPGMQRVGFSRRLRPDELDAHTKQVRAEGFPDYTVWPDGAREEYTSIVYLEPFARNLRAFGYDMFSDPVRRAAMQRARDTGETTISGKVRLVQETDKKAESGFVMYVPVYRRGYPLTSGAERRAALVGYVYAPFQVNNLMTEVLGARISDLHIDIYDGPSMSPQTLLYDGRPDRSGNGLFNSKVVLDLYGRVWSLQVTSLPAFEETIDRQKPLLVLLGGILLSFLLAGISWSLAVNREKAAALGEMNRDLLAEVSERRRTEDSLQRANRTLQMLSGINTLIVRVRDRDELFKEACGIAVEEGGFRMSLICIVDRNSMKIVPVASAGKAEGLLTTIKDNLSSDERAPNTMVARAIAEKVAVVSNDAQSDQKVFFAKQYAESGVRSMAVLPLIVAGEAIGVFALYSIEMEFFHQEEMRLLTELAGDIAFAIDHIDKQEQLDYLAYYDALTGLANRSLLHNRLSQSLHTRGGEQPLIATVLLDLARFRRVNETLGRSMGDELLRSVGSRLLRANDTAARIGADMYALILRGAHTAAEVNRALEAIVAACFAEPFTVGREQLRIVCHAGVALYPEDGVDADALLRNAEAALRGSKQSGDRIVFYAPDMNARVAEALAIETRLRRAIDHREFVLHYQPKVSLASGRIAGVEALIRWRDPDKGLIPPARFIPVLEETGMIIEVGRWVVEQAFVDLRTWAAHGIRVPRVAVNVSAIQLQAKNFVESMIDEIRRGGDFPERLELEITESIVMGNIEDNIRKLSILRGMGVTVAIDDFGTGYSSLSYLSKLPLDSLKIDQSFVSRMTDGGEAVAIVSTIIALGHGLKLKVVAEGVETEEQSQSLKQLRCDEGQGYLFAKPMPGESIEAMLRAQTAGMVSLDSRRL